MRTFARTLLLALLLCVMLLIVGARGRAQTTATQSASSGAPIVSFSKLAARVEVESNELEITAVFTLGDASKGINPLSQKVSLRVGNFSMTIPDGSFKTSSLGWFKYEGAINDVDLEVKILPLGANRFGLRAEASAKGLVSATPGHNTDVEISIDDNQGSAMVKPERSWF